jgi:hypothetical protein
LIRQKRSIIGFSQYKVNKALAERDKKKQNELETQGFILGKNDKKMSKKCERQLFENLSTGI